MAWIKRNLYFVIGAVVAVVLLGLAGFYLYSRWNLNNQKWENLSKAYEDLKRLNSQPIHPGSGPVDNIKAAKEQSVELRAFLNKLRTTFRKIPSIPDLPKIKDHDFSFALSRTISGLRVDATNVGVILPPDFNFSFTAQSRLVTFPAGSLEPLSIQLGEVKAICDVLFQAKVNALDFIHRERVSADDAAGSATDYLVDKAVTNDLAILTPYELSFRCFSPDLAAVLANFASSSHGFIVKTINVETVGTSTPGIDAAGNPIASTPYPTPTGTLPPKEFNPYDRYGPRPGPPGNPVPIPVSSSASASRGSLPTVLDERPLKVTIVLNVVKLLPPLKEK